MLGRSQEVFGVSSRLMGVFFLEEGSHLFLVLLASEQNKPLFPHGVEIFFTPCKYLVYGKMNATRWGILSTFSWKDLVCI